MKYWITTDTHFNHWKMLEYCGRPNDFEHKIFKGLSGIPSSDILIHLGDVCIGRDMEMHNNYIVPLQCKKILVLGNHDKKSPQWYMTNGWDFALKGLRLKVSGKRILLTHMPQPDDHWYDINIHGHFHNSDHRSHEPDLVKVKNEKHKLLALEYTNYQPVSLEDFIK